MLPIQTGLEQFFFCGHLNLHFKVISTISILLYNYFYNVMYSVYVVFIYNQLIINSSIDTPSIFGEKNQKKHDH